MPSNAPQPFARFDSTTAPSNNDLRSHITPHWHLPEAEALAPLLTAARMPPAQAEATQALALRLAGALRRRHGSGRAGLVQEVLQEFALSSQEGVALMCLAEALLRVPDAATRDALIRDKIARGHWEAHLGKSPSLFVNAASWGLLLTGVLVSTHSEAGLSAALTRLIGKGGEPLIRKGVALTMELLGEQFVAGRTIEEAMARAQPREAAGFRHSYDMLGEAALTAADARRYLDDYERAIHAIGGSARAGEIHERAGVSIKLSALHPRYCHAQYGRVMRELYPALLHLVTLARRYDIGIHIDAEEAHRLELSLDLLARLCQEPAFAGWNGIGFVVQAYQKRCAAVLDYLIDLGRRSGHRLMVRLVKGAYWDSEIKRAQVEGLADYPVFTRKCHTDVAYLACARQLLAASDAVFPQFATHNAHTLAAIYHLADPARFVPGQYEFQCLHGMGEPLYAQVVGSGSLARPCRIYAPVGTHETLLPYLVRRLLENGANSSFVHQSADPAVALDALVRDPVETVDALARREGAAGLPHPALPLPRALYGSVRLNSQGMNLADDRDLHQLAHALHTYGARSWVAAPMLAVDTAPGTLVPVRNPADQARVVGQVQAATPEDVETALAHAVEGAARWSEVAPAQRAAILDAAAQALEAKRERFFALLVHEAGKTWSSAVSEVREAADFLRYDAAQVRALFDNATHRPLGPVVCISPWNFPLAIFVGQIAAALAAGNAVLAKPSEQTPLVAAEAVRVLWQAGVPRAALQLLPGPGARVGARLVADVRVQGVMFTGSTEVARLLQQSLSERLSRDGGSIPLIAETGGQNEMIVDSSALTEQVVSDVLSSAFDSAGQRCSALRVLCLQEDIADRTLAMLRGAMAELRIGAPDQLATDVGPVIDHEARDQLLRHIEAMRASGHAVEQVPLNPEATRDGSFVPPTLIALRRLDELKGEVFGPVLHWLTYARRDLDALVDQINRSGYALTLGIHTRIDETVERVTARARAGNVYVNRNMIGAVVGVQPFGGEGLSGTGPKAGGPLCMYRLLARRPDNAIGRALTREGAPYDTPPRPSRAPFVALTSWAHASGRVALAQACERFAAPSCSGVTRLLTGPTGERNTYTLAPRDAVLCLAEDEEDRLVQLAAVLAMGSHAVWPDHAAALRASLPTTVQARIRCIADGRAPPSSSAPAIAPTVDVVLHHGSAAALKEAARHIARWPGAIRSVHGLAPGDTEVRLEWLLRERTVSVNTAAAGGNASLMMVE